MEEAKKETETKEKTKKVKKRVWIVLGFILIMAIYLLVSLRGEYLNILELGEKYTDVFAQNLQYNYTVLLTNFIIVFVLVYITNKFIKKGLRAFFDEDKIEMPKLPNKSIALIVGAIISILVSPMMTEKVILAMNTAWFGITDPIFNMDIGYFFFQKPFWELVLIYAIALLVFLAVYTTIYYIVVFNVYLDGINLQTLKQNTFLKQMFTYVILIAICIATLTFNSPQNILNEKFINISGVSDGVIYGAGLTDVTIKVWGYRILAIIIVLAIVIAINYFRMGKNKKAVVCLATIPGYLVCLFVVMTAFQFLYVNTNEFDREKIYIGYNIENTKKAYNINIDEKEITNSGVITIDEVADNMSLIENIPIVTKDVTLKSLEEYQTSTGYYTYKNSNITSYFIDGNIKLIYVSPREIESDNRRTYDSKTYEYTHGYGAILTDATKTDDNGNIVYIQKEFDGSDEQISISEPRIYFGLKTNSNIIVNSKNKKEFDYPITSSTNTENVYNGEAGLNLNFIDRLILGIKNGDMKLAFNSDITKNSKIITNRNIIERAKTVMPYLVYDKNPYMVIREDGSLIWVLDAYTISNSYPYSQESMIDVNGTKTKINYIRNSVKVLIDSYNGTMHFYLTDRSDPIAMAYYNVYNGLFMPLESEIPEDISKHIVYPKYLYDIQAQMLTKYHDIQTEVLYRNDDAWSIAKTTTNRAQASSDIEAYYTMLKVEDSNTEQFSLVIPYTPYKKQNINAYLVGTYNGKNELKLYKFRSDDNVLGIMQLESQIERDELISQELATINVTGSRLIKNMMVIPIESTLLYVEPIYQVMLNESQVPILKKVIVASGNRVAIGDNLEAAINNLVSKQSVELQVQNTDSKDGLIETIIKANNNLEESSNNKDWELIGKDIGRLQELIKELEKLIEEEKKNQVSNTIDMDNTVNTNTLFNTINTIKE